MAVRKSIHKRMGTNSTLMHSNCKVKIKNKHFNCIQNITIFIKINNNIDSQ